MSPEVFFYLFLYIVSDIYTYIHKNIYIYIHLLENNSPDHQEYETHRHELALFLFTF